TGRSFDQKFTYDNMGEVVTLGYPTCCSTGPARDLSKAYKNGFLDRIDNYAKAFEYWPNGLYHTIQHVRPDNSTNGPLITQDLDPSAMPRPASYSISGITDCPAPDATVSGTSPVNAGGSGSASVATTTGATYAWSITNGSFTTATNGSSVAFTA